MTPTRQIVKPDGHIKQTVEETWNLTLSLDKLIIATKNKQFLHYTSARKERSCTQVVLLFGQLHPHLTDHQLMFSIPLKTHSFNSKVKVAQKHFTQQFRKFNSFNPHSTSSSLLKHWSPTSPQTSITIHTHSDLTNANDCPHFKSSVLLIAKTN